MANQYTKRKWPTSKGHFKKEFQYASPKAALERFKEFTKQPLLTVNIANCTHTDILFAPPIGHLGVYASMELPVVELPKGEKRQVQPNDKIMFVRYMDEPLMLGTVTAIENPGDSIRPDMATFREWYKIHWTPSDDSAIKHLHRTLPINNCPKCNSKGRVYETKPAAGKRLRFRKCSRCKTKWSTVETYVGTIDESPTGS